MSYSSSGFLCLSLLATLLLGVIALGNLLQSSDNAQNAADAAVLAGEDVLVQEGSQLQGLFATPVDDSTAVLIARLISVELRKSDLVDLAITSISPEIGCES